MYIYIYILRSIERELHMLGWFGLDCKPLKMLWSVPQCSVFPDRMMSLHILNMHLIDFDVSSKYLRLGFW